MGYRTNYEITVEGLKSEEEAALFCYKLEQETDYTFDKKIDPREFFIQFISGSIKFYEYDEVFKRLAGLFPHVTIDVYGEGEESGDIWKHRFKNDLDEWAEAIITFPEFTI